MKRRAFMQRLAAAGILTGIPHRWSAFTKTDADDRALPGLPAFFDDPDTIAAIGRAYLSHHPNHRNTVLLSKLLNARLRPAEPSRLKTSISRRIREDFSAGDTLQLDGWILSRTEAQQCALYFLTYS